MQVWNVLHAARWKYRTQKWRKNSPSVHHRTTLWVWIFATKTYVDNRKKLVNQQYLLHMLPQNIEIRSRSGCEVLQWACLSVCLSARISQKQHVWASRNFLYVLTVVVRRGPLLRSDDSTICNVLPILWMIYHVCTKANGTWYMDNHWGNTINTLEVAWRH